MGQNPAIAHVRYHRNDLIIEASHVAGFMAENYAETRCRHKDGCGRGDRIAVGRNTTHTGYKLRRAPDLQAQAVCSHLGLKEQAALTATVAATPSRCPRDGLRAAVHSQQQPPAHSEPMVSPSVGL